MLSAVLSHDQIIWKPKYVMMINFLGSSIFVLSTFKQFVTSTSEFECLQITIAILSILATIITAVLSYRWYTYLRYSRNTLKPDDYYCSIYVLMVFGYLISLWAMFIFNRNDQIYQLNSNSCIFRLWLHVATLILAMTIHRVIDCEQHQQTKVMI